MCACRSSTQRGSLSPRTASLRCGPALVSISYRYTPRGETGRRSCTIASYVHSRATGATTSEDRSSTRRSHVGAAGTAVWPGTARMASMRRYTRCATAAAGDDVPGDDVPVPLPMAAPWRSRGIRRGRRGGWRCGPRRAPPRRRRLGRGMDRGAEEDAKGVGLVCDEGAGVLGDVLEVELGEGPECVDEAAALLHGGELRGGAGGGEEDARGGTDAPRVSSRRSRRTGARQTRGRG